MPDISEVVPGLNLPARSFFCFLTCFVVTLIELPEYSV